MKRLLSAVLVCAVLLSSFSGMVSFAGYQLNKSFIAKVLCINKEVPEKNCQGKCHLKKELEKQEDQQKNSGNTIDDKQFNIFNGIGSTINFNSLPIFVSAKFPLKNASFSISRIKFGFSSAGNRCLLSDYLFYNFLITCFRAKVLMQFNLRVF
ncbi:MAG: hypothetical protein IPL22_00470 [Bacteroidetes bacterium]|nr:hypothetical protein [Bacteroidota bacterium]